MASSRALLAHAHALAGRRRPISTPSMTSPMRAAGSSIGATGRRYSPMHGPSSISACFLAASASSSLPSASTSVVFEDGIDSPPTMSAASATMLTRSFATGSSRSAKLFSSLEEELEQLNAETTELLISNDQSNANQSNASANQAPPSRQQALILTRRYANLHSKILTDPNTKNATYRRSRRRNSNSAENSAEGNAASDDAAALRMLVRCAEQVERLLRVVTSSPATGTTAASGASGGSNGSDRNPGSRGSSGGNHRGDAADLDVAVLDEQDELDELDEQDELAPYRLSMLLWSQTPTSYSGDRAAAILEDWGDAYGGDMLKQPTIKEFDVVLEGYALSSAVYGRDEDGDAHMENAVDVDASAGDGGASDAKDGGEVDEDDGEKSKKVEDQHPEERALSTLRLLRALGNMYLVPTITTVSHVIHALRRASRTPRGYNDGRNEERTRTVMELLREMEGEVAELFGYGRVGSSSRNDDEGNKEEQQMKYHYVRACCDAFTMAARSLPMEEAADEARYWLNEIDTRAFGGGTMLNPSLSNLTTPYGQSISVPYLVEGCCNYTIRGWRDRAAAASDTDLVRPPSPADRLNHIRLAAQSADDILTKLQKWDDIKVDPKQYRRVADIFCLSTHPSIVHAPPSVIDAKREVVPLVERAEELVLEMGRKRHDGMVDLETYNQLIGSWAQLSGAVPLGGPGTNISRGGPERPAERAEHILQTIFRKREADHKLPVHIAYERDATKAYNLVLSAWARSKTGHLGAKKALALFDEMCGINMDYNDADLHLDVRAQPDEMTYSALLKALRYAGSRREVEKAMSILNEMIERYKRGDEGVIRPNTRHFGTVVAAIAQSGHYQVADEAKKLLKTLLVWYHETKDIEMMPSRFMFCDVITIIGRKRNDRDMVLKVSNLLKNLKDLHEETGSSRLEPTVEVYGAALGALANARGEDALQKMEDLREEMKSESIEPNKLCYTSIITAYSRNGLPEVAESVLEEMDSRYDETGEEDIRPNAHVFTAAINAWSRTGTPKGVERSRALLDEMLDRYSKGDDGVKPNSHTFTSLINVLWKSGEDNATVEAEEVLNLMEESYAEGDITVAPSAHAYASVINTWARSDAADKAVRAQALLRRAQSQYESGNIDAKPNVSMYTGVLNACAYTKGTKDDIDNALRIALETAEELMGGSASTRADSVAINTLFQAYGYLVANEEERTRLSAVLFKLCCKHGLLNGQIVSTLKKFAPIVYYKLPGAYDGFVKLTSLPAQWTRNNSSSFQRR